MGASRKANRWLALGGITLGVIAVWGFVLPALSETEIVRQRQAFLEENRINPSAMFYTEYFIETKPSPVGQAVPDGDRVPASRQAQPDLREDR